MRIAAHPTVSGQVNLIKFTIMENKNCTKSGNDWKNESCNTGCSTDHFKNTVKEKAAEIKDRVSENATHIKNSVHEKATEIKDRLSEKVGEYKDAAKEKIAEAADKVKDAVTK